MSYFSIIIPTYNRAAFIGITLTSVLAQTFEDFEIIIVDDGSTDNTDAIVATFNDPRIAYIKQSNAERGAARNRGAQAAKGVYVNFLDSDDYIYPNHLQEAFNFVGRNNHPEVFHLSYEIVDEDGRTLRKVTRNRSITFELIYGNVLSCNGVFVKRQTFQQNQFVEDRSLASLEDWELWLRLAARYSILNCDVVTSAVVQHDQRSVNTAAPGKIVEKANALLSFSSGDAVNVQFYGRKLRRLFANVYTYAALHLAMIGGQAKGMSASLLLKGITTHPAELFQLRFLAIVKRLLIK